MIRIERFKDSEDGVAAIELAFGFPILIGLIWMIFQLGLVFRANSGIQHSLGEGARQGTLFPTPTNTQLATRMNTAVYGIGPGVFNIVVADPVNNPATTIDESKSGYKDLTVTYTQQTNLLVAPGPNVSLTKRKRVWVTTVPTGTPQRCTSTTSNGVPSSTVTCAAAT